MPCVAHQLEAQDAWHSWVPSALRDMSSQQTSRTHVAPAIGKTVQEDHAEGDTTICLKGDWRSAPPSCWQSLHSRFADLNGKQTRQGAENSRSENQSVGQVTMQDSEELFECMRLEIRAQVASINADKVVVDRPRDKG